MDTKARKINGIIKSGKKEAGKFLEINWVKEQCRKICGFTPFPGTLNLEVNPADADFIRQLACARGKRVIPPSREDDYCEGRLLSLRVEGLEAALIYPMVDDYYGNTVEIIAPVELKMRLGKNSGDFLEFELEVPEKLPLPGGIIFDLDGTLIDSIDLYYSILCEGLQQLNLAIPERKQFLKLMGAGIGFWEAWDSVTSTDIAEFEKEDMRKRCNAVCKEIWRYRYEKDVRLVPGASNLLARLQKAGVKMGVVTSSIFVNKMNLFGRISLNYQELFQSIVTWNDTVKKKPHPEPFRRCLEEMGLESKDCICVGDAPCDIIAGRDCGLQTVGLMSGAGTLSSLSREGADLILDGVARLEQFFKMEHA